MVDSVATRMQDYYAKLDKGEDVSDFNVVKNQQELEINIIFFVLITSLISQIGDLIISNFKRQSNVKNTGKIIPGHGGLLDRIDGMIFAFPFMFFLIKFL